MNIESWNEWDESGHIDSEQVKRQKSAAKADITPISIGDDYAVFRGSKKNYETSLVQCTCTDYGIRRRPCKHMYRLAYELGLFHLDNVKIDNSVAIGLRIDEAMEIIESLPEESQKLFHDIIYDYQYRKGYSIISSEDADILLSHNLIKDYPDKKELLKRFTKADLISKLPDVSPEILKFKKTELMDYIDTHHSSVYDALFENAKAVTLHDSVHKLAIAMNRRLCQKFPREETSWFNY